jgi:hypothetical protein
MPEDNKKALARAAIAHVFDTDANPATPNVSGYRLTPAEVQSGYNLSPAEVQINRATCLLSKPRAS